MQQQTFCTTISFLHIILFNPFVASGTELFDIVGLSASPRHTQRISCVTVRPLLHTATPPDLA